MKKCLSLIALILASSLLFVIEAQTLAFPTAEGFGALATGGRGGKVVVITNLEDDANNPPEGSFRWALQQHPGEPITVIFKVSGLIDLKSELRCKRDNFTIAGQTAPGDGICIKGNKVNLGGSTNFILRHLRFRIGVVVKADGTPDAAGNGSIGIKNSKNFIVDHCTFGWSGEENMTVYDNHYTTVQWCIIHEGLYASGHNKGARSYATQWGGSPATYHHNLIAHNVSRTPRINGAGNILEDRNVLLDYINNVNYNWGGSLGCYGGEREVKGATHECNFVNNYYKQGPATNTSWTNFVRIERQRDGRISVGPSYWYITGNKMVDINGATISKVTDDNWLGINNNSGYLLDSLKWPAPFNIEEKYQLKTIESADDAFLSVLDRAGAFPRDAVDTRIIDETFAGTASGKGTKETFLKGGIEQTSPFYNIPKGIIDEPEGAGGYPVYNSESAPVDSDGDGMPDDWELANGLDPNDPADGNKMTVSGYTALEVYLNGLVGEVIDLDFTSINNKYQSSHFQASASRGRLHLYTDQDVNSVTLINTLGQVCLSDFSKSKIIDITSCPNDIYIVKVKFNDNQEAIAKISNEK